MLSMRTEVAAVAEASDERAVGAEHVDDALLNEVHLVAESALAHHQVVRLEHLEMQSAHHFADELGIRVCEERHRRHQRAAVEVDHLLHAEHSTTVLYLHAMTNGTCTVLMGQSVDRVAFRRALRHFRHISCAFHN